jgi:hypothetical protein
MPERREREREREPLVTANLCDVFVPCLIKSARHLIHMKKKK